MTEKVRFTKSSGNPFKDVSGFSDYEAKKLQFRAYLMSALKKYIQSQNLTQTEAGKRLGVSQARVSDLTHCRLDRFSNEMLLDMLERLGFKIYERLELDIEQAMKKAPFRLSPPKGAKAI